MLEMEAVMCFCKNRSQLPGFLLSASLGILFSCSSAPSAPDAALRSFSADRILGHIRTLSSDEFEGRGPGSKGEQLTIKYLEDQYRSFGLEPGNPDGTYLQSVPLVGITPDKGMKLTLAGHGGTAMTYYGRWTYKFEKAAQLGASGCVIIHQTDRAGYPWEVVRNSWSGTQFDLAAPDKNMGRLAVESWITSDFAAKLFRLAGQNLDKIIQAAARRDFKPIPLGIHEKLTIHNSLQTIDSHNVIAKITGSDPELKNSYVIYTAHWDHFGIGPEVNGDKIYHGAVDNAS